MRAAAVFALLWVCVVSPTAAEPPREDVIPLFVSGSAGYGRYRVPALLVTPQKTVLAFSEGRVKPSRLTGDIDLVVRRSTDSGATWSPLAVVADDGPNTLGNPCPVVDRSTGRIWLPFTRSLGQDTEEEITSGTSDGRTQVWLTHSSDDGQTWAPPVNISAQATRSEWTWYGTGPGIGLQLADGRLFVPCYHAVEKTGIYRTHSLYSDDHGATWRIGGILRDETTEAQVALRRDGTLAINARNIAPRDRTVLRHRVVGVSRDGGETWGEVTTDPALSESSCEGSLLVFSGLDDNGRADAASGRGERSRWLFTNPPGPGRNRLTLRLSHDEGRTWARSMLIEPGSAECSSLARLPDGTIGLIYERNTKPDGFRIDIVFTRIAIADLELE
jgi:sialidase-1